MIIGYDGGYSDTKAVGGSGAKRVKFPSLVGTPDKARFSLSLGQEDSIILLEPQHVQIGDGAVRQSRFVHRREDRAWIESDEWYNLFLASITELTTATRVNLHVVTGLPVAFFNDREKVKERLLNTHTVKREGRHAQTFAVETVNVVPQPFGALLSQALNDHGHISDRDVATGTIGIIDVGGKTTNLLSVESLAEISRETASVNVGAWDAVRNMRSLIAGACPDLDLRDHQIVRAIIDRRVKYYGDFIDLAEKINSVVEPLASAIIAQATQLWNGGAQLDVILISGGGAYLLGPRIESHFRHARVISDPTADFANAVGFWRFGKYLSRDRR